MSSVIAIVSKKVFESDARVDKKVPGIGQTWALDQYVSKVAGLKALEGGGALFLCTVRPPDEQLWLVAVLENPVFDGDKWTSKPNVVPIRDVSRLIPEFKFTSGTGIKAEPGKLGMSLQTPRQLTEEDVKLLRGESVVTQSSPPAAKKDAKSEIPKPAAKTPKADPRDALNSMLSAADAKELFGALDRSKNAPAVAQKTAVALAKKLGQTPEALAVLDCAAEVLLEAEKYDQAAKVFTAARALEKKLPKGSVTRSNTETLSLYARFARCGAVDERTISSLGTALTKAKEPVAIPFAELVASFAENAPLSILLIHAAGKVAQSKNVDVEECFEIIAKSAGRHISGQKEAGDDVWIALGPKIVKAATESGNLDALLDLFPNHQAIKDPGTWRAILDQSEGLKHLQEASSKRVTEWVQKALDWRPWPNEEDFLWFESWLKPLGPKCEKLKKGTTDPELMEICLASGIELDASAWADSEISLGNWQKRPPTPYGELVRLSSHPEFGPCLKRTLKNRLLNEPFQHKWTLTPLWSEVAAAYVAFLKDLSERGTVAAFDMHIKALETSLSDTGFEHVPGLREVVGKMDFARALKISMNHGIMDEWHWPALEEANARLSEDCGQYNTDGPFPYFVLWHDGKVVVIGPEGIVLEGEFSPPEGVDGFRTMRYVPGPNGTVGDVLFVYFQGSLTTGVWLSKPDERIQGRYGGTWMNAILPESGGLNEGQNLLMPGSKELMNWSGGYYRVLSDGKTAYRTERSKLEAFDPVTGKVLNTEIHPFLTTVDGKKKPLKTTSLLPVPPSAKDSPLGQKDGLSGFRSWNVGTTWHGEGFDGESWSGTVAANQVGGIWGLFRFPERADVLPVIDVSGDLSIWLKDGSFPVVPAQHANWYVYWFGAPQWLPMIYWHLLKPADPAGSRALRDATDAQATALLQAARQAKPMNKDTLLEDQASVRELVPGFSRTNTPENFVEVLHAAKAAMPEIKAPRLLVGLCNLAVTAAKLESRVAVLLEMAKTQGVAIQTTGRPDQEFRVIDRLFGQGAAWSKSTTEDQIRVADELLKAPQSPDEPVARNVPQSSLDWLRALAHMRSLAYRVLAPGTPLNSRNMLRELLKLFATTGMVLHPERYRVFMGTFEAWPVAGMTHETGQRVLSVDNGLNRYLITCRHFDPQRKVFDFQMLEHSFDGEFKDPPGCVLVKWSVPLVDRVLTRQQIEKTLEVFEDRGVFEPDAAAAAHIAEKTGLLPGSAMMLLAAAWKPWEMKSDVREHLGLKVADVELGLQELNVSWHKAYQDAFSTPELLYTPMTPGKDGKSLVDKIVDSVLEEVGVRSPLPTEIVKNMQSTLTGNRPYHLDVRVLENPEKWAFLTADERWVIRPWKGFKNNVSYMQGFIPPGWPKHAGMPEGEVHPNVNTAFSGWALKHFMPYLAWAQLELPRGDARRIGAAKMAALMRERLKNPDLLMLAGAVDLSLEQDPRKLSEAFEDLRGRFKGKTYVALDDLPPADGVDRGDLVVTWPSDLPNSFFFAFRPAHLQDIASLEKLADELGFKDVFQPRRSGCTCGLNFGFHKVVDFTDLSSFVAWSQPGFQRMLNTLELAGDGFDANPVVSAPEAVSRAQKAHDLSQDEACLLLQLRALAEPTEERVRRYNGWDKKRYKAAADGLVKRGLAEEKKFNGSKRTLFVPGAVEMLSAPASPMEAAKLELYSLDVDAKGVLRAPFGVVLPLKPLGELFEALPS